MYRQLSVDHCDTEGNMRMMMMKFSSFKRHLFVFCSMMGRTVFKTSAAFISSSSSSGFFLRLSAPIRPRDSNTDAHFLPPSIRRQRVAVQSGELTHPPQVSYTTLLLVSWCLLANECEAWYQWDFTVFVPLHHEVMEVMELRVEGDNGSLCCVQGHFNISWWKITHPVLKLFRVTGGCTWC